MPKESAIPRSPVLQGARLVMIARNVDSGVLMDAAGALVGIGLRHLEVTVDSPTAYRDIDTLRSRFPDLIVGAGTVRRAEEATAAAVAGSQFLVSPHFSPSVSGEAGRHNLPYVPGAYTPTEIVNAWEQGASMVKLFPASTLGTGFLKHLRGPLPDIPLIVTGGVSAEHAAGYLQAGANAVGMGSQFFRRWQESADGEQSRLLTATANLMASLDAVYGS